MIRPEEIADEIRRKALEDQEWTKRMRKWGKRFIDAIKKDKWSAYSTEYSYVDNEYFQVVVHVRTPFLISAKEIEQIRKDMLTKYDWFDCNIEFDRVYLICRFSRNKEDPCGGQ